MSDKLWPYYSTLGYNVNMPFSLFISFNVFRLYIHMIHLFFVHIDNSYFSPP